MSQITCRFALFRAVYAPILPVWDLRLRLCKRLILTQKSLHHLQLSFNASKWMQGVGDLCGILPDRGLFE